MTEIVIMGNKDSKSNKEKTDSPGFNIFLRPQLGSAQLSQYLANYRSISRYTDPYFGDCHALQSSGGHTCILQKETTSSKEKAERVKNLKELEVSINGPGYKYLVGTRIIASLEQNSFISSWEEVYVEHDFILTDLKKEFEFRRQEGEEFS